MGIQRTTIMKQAQRKREYLRILKLLITNRIVSTIELNKCLEHPARGILLRRLQRLRRIYGFDIRHRDLGITNKVYYYLK